MIVMDAKIILPCLGFVVVGILLIFNNKFHKQKSDTMLFPTELKLFLTGFILCILGCYGLVSELSKLFK